jgi:hypothetical protein
MSKNELKRMMESLFSKFQEEATNSLRQQHPSQPTLHQLLILLNHISVLDIMLGVEVL